MARHRSPKGRRAHLGPPLPAIAAAGAGGVHRSIPVPQLGFSQLTSSATARFVATAVAGGALAAMGQQALEQRLPDTVDGSNVLQLGVQQLLGTAATDPAAGATPVGPPASAAVGAPAVGARPLVTALAPVSAAPSAPETGVLEASELVKATELNRRAAERAERARVAEANAAAAAATRAALDRAVQGRAAAGAAGTAAAGKAAERAGTDTSSLGGGAVQLVTGRVTSGFGARWGVRHEGLDIAAPIGTPIRVPLAGTVVDSGPASGFGLWVRVRHADGTVTTYGHINRSLVRKGQQVTAGQEIAQVGNRGQSTGPHLHIEVTTPGGIKINPRPWLDQHEIGY